MKYLMIFVFLAAIFAATKSKPADEKCAEPSGRMMPAAEKCFDPEIYSEEAMGSFLNDDESMSDEAKKIALCVVIELGEFKNGQFDLESIEKQLREEIGWHSKGEDMIKFTLTSARNANLAGGDDSQKAFAFTISQRAEEYMDMVDKVYCGLW